MMRELGYCQGIENYSRFIWKTIRVGTSMSFDFVPKNAIVFIDESHVTIPQIGAMYKETVRGRKPLWNMLSPYC